MLQRLCLSRTFRESLRAAVARTYTEYLSTLTLKKIG